MLVIEYPHLTPTTNEIIRKYSHPQAKKRKRDQTIMELRAALPASARGRGIDCCEITITRYGRNDVDWDNLGGGLKFLLDALVHWKVIIDDKRKVVRRLHLEQEIDRARPRVRIEIVELLDG